MNVYTIMVVSHLEKGNNSCDFLFVSMTLAFQNGYTLKEKNLLLQEQILFLKSRT